MSDLNDADLLQSAIRGEIARMHTSIPGTVLSYDHATQRATVQVAVRSKVRAARGGEITNVDVPPIPGVPVCFPSAAGIAITWPLTPGDPVLLVFAERSLDEWKSTGNASNDAQDIRRFDLSDAVAIPGSVSPASPIPAEGRDAAALVMLAAMIKLGGASATDFVALASLVTAQFNTLKAAISAAPVVAGDGGASFKASLIAALSAWPGNVGATKVKAE